MIILNLKFWKGTEDLIIYKYSNKNYFSNHEWVYQYFYDDFSSGDCKNSYVILFIGKIWESKNYINKAFFNIIKGVN